MYLVFEITSCHGFVRTPAFDYSTIDTSLCNLFVSVLNNFRQIDVIGNMPIEEYFEIKLMDYFSPNPDNHLWIISKNDFKNFLQYFPTADLGTNKFFSYTSRPLLNYKWFCCTSEIDLYPHQS